MVKKVVLVEWDDASNYPGWINIEEATNQKPLCVVTTGFLLKSNKDCIYLGFSWNSRANEVWGAKRIPRSLIRKIKTLYKIC